MSFLPLSFGFPAILLGLAALPVIWWLLRLTPPKPRSEIFPPLAILARVMRKEETPRRSPWWLTLLRLVMAALVILALAEPVLNPREATPVQGGALALVIDNGWAAAPDWDVRVATAQRLIADAADKPVVLAFTAERANAEIGPFDAAEAQRRLAAAAPRPVPDRALIAASAALLLDEQDRAERLARSSGDPYSPWNRRDGWRLHGVASAEVELMQDGVGRPVRAEYGDGAWTLRFATEAGEFAALTLRARRGLDHDALLLDVDGVRTRATVRRYGDDIVVTLPGPDPATATLTVRQPLGATAGVMAASGAVSAPIPGRVVKVMAETGQAVARGETLVIIEAMKTELRIAAPVDGTVTRVSVQAGDLVAEGTELVFVEADADG